MGKKKHSFDDKQKSETNQNDEHEPMEMPVGWKEPPFTKEDNPHGRIALLLIQIKQCHLLRFSCRKFICNFIS